MASSIEGNGKQDGAPVADPPEGPYPGAPKAGQIAIPPGARIGTRPFGRSGVSVSMIGLGGYHIGVPKDVNEATRIMHKAIDHGVTFFDNCWDYHDGESEERMGRALAEGSRRDKVFLMTKIDARTRHAAAGQIDTCLRRLRTDRIDLLQIHEVIRKDDADRVFAPGGAMEALFEAQKAGKIRFIGFTGHKDPDIHLRMLHAGLERGFTFDAVQMPLNVFDPHYRSFERLVVPVLVQHGVAVLGMKPFAGGLFFEAKPPVEPVECLRYALSLPTSVVITGCDSEGVLDQAIRVALDFTPMTAAEVADVRKRSQSFAKEGAWEQFKTTPRFDGTTANPEWLDSPTP